MTAFYEALQRTAAKMLTDKGQQVTLQRRVIGDYDPALSAATEATTTYTLSAVVLDFPSKEVDGTNILRTDKKVLMDASSVVPQEADSIVIGGVAHAVVSVLSLSPAGLPVIYTLQVRKGG